MESSLKSQLNKLKDIQKSEPNLPSNSEATFLFDFHNSRRIDIDTIFSLGYSGLVELSRCDNSFVKYFQNLFNNTSKYFNRETKREEELKSVDLLINQFLVELSPYFLHKATHRVLEFLIKIYNVNVYNSKQLFLSFLPYHESKYFLKLIQNINFERFNTLSFFVPFVKNGVVILKETFYKELINNFNLLREIFNFYEGFFTQNNTNVDDSEYFLFLSDIFSYLIKSKEKVDINLLNLIIQFLNKVFKSYKNKFENVQNNEDYEEKITNGLSELIFILFRKVSLSFEYSKAIVNEIINKILINLKCEDNLEKFENVLLFVIEEINTKNNSLLIKETLRNLNENMELINKPLRDRDIVTILITIVNSSEDNDNTIDSDLILKFLKTNFGNISDENVKIFIKFLFDQICKDEIKFNKDDFVPILSYIDDVYNQQMNSVLIEIFTNKNHSKNYIENVKEVTRSINEYYEKILDSQSEGEVNAFNLFLNLNSSNVSLVLHSIKKFDQLVNSNENEKEKINKLINYSISSLTNKFSFLDKEIILMEILQMKSFKNILSTFESFREEFIQFYYKLYQENIKLYTKEFLNKVEENVITQCVNENEESNLKILIHYLLIKEEESITLLENNIYLQKIIVNTMKNKNLSLIDSFISYLCSHSNSHLNAVNFFKILSQILSVKSDLIKNDKIVEIVKKILIKDIEKINYLKNISIDELNYTLEILSIKELSKFNSNLFERISEVLIEVIPTNHNNDLFEIIGKLSLILIKNNQIKIFEKLVNTHFKSTKQNLLSYLIIRNKINNNNFLDFVQENLKDKIEANLIFALLYSMSQPETDTKTIFKILESATAKKLKIVKTNFNMLLTNQETKIFKVDIADSETHLSNLLQEIISRKNEIFVNRNYLKKLIKSKCNIELFSLINEIFINKSEFTNKEELDGLKDLIELFVPEMTNQNKKLANTLLKKELLNLYKNITDKENIKTELINVIEILLTGVEILISNSTIDILKLLINSNKIKFSKNLIEFLFSKQNFSLDEENLNLTKDLEFTYKLIKFALKNNINAEVFLTTDENFGLNLLDFINQNKIVCNEDDQFILYYIFKIIFINNNSYFNLNYVIKTLFSLKLLRENSDSLMSNSMYLNLSNNLLTIISNCTIEAEENSVMKKSIEELKLNIFYTIKKFKDSNVDTSSSLESVHIVNTLFLCINKLVSQFTKIEEEREIVKNLITDCFNILNQEDDTYLSSVVKDEVYLIFINAIKNFIEIIFESHKQYLNQNESYEIFYEYIHYFVNFTLTLVKFKFKETKTIEQTLKNFLNISTISNNEKFLACFFVNLFYYNFTNSVENNQNYYSDLIFDFFNRDEDSQFTKLSLDVILQILNQLSTNSDKIFHVENIQNNNKKFDTFFLTLNLVNKILNIIDYAFFNLNKIKNVNETLLNLCLNINSIRKQLNNKMKNNTNNSENNFNLCLKELKHFEGKLFSDMNESKLLHSTILLIYDEKRLDKQMRNYMLTKYLEMIIVTGVNSTEDELSDVFEYLINIVTHSQEDKVDNLQLIFSILTKLLNIPNQNKLLSILKKENNLNKILSTLDFSIETANKNNTLFNNFSIYVFVSKIFCVFNNKFLDKFNEFLSKILNSFDLLIEIKNEELTILALETFRNLSKTQSEFFSPYLKEIVFKLLLIINSNNNPIVIKLIDSILENISSKQMLENTFETTKFCIKNMKDVSLFNQSLSSLMNFLKISLSLSDKLMIAGLYNNILKFFIKLLLNKNINSDKVTDCLKSFILKINEKQLKQIFSDILKFAKEPGDYENDFKYRLEYSIVTFEIFNTILKTISIIFVPYFEKYKSYWTDLLIYTNAIFSAEDKRNLMKKKQNRNNYNSAYDDEDNKFSYLYLNSLLLENIKLNFKFNSESKILTETIEEMIEPLVGQLKFIFFENEEEKLMKYFDSDIRTAFVAIFMNLKSEEIFKEFNDSVRNNFKFYF